MSAVDGIVPESDEPTIVSSNPTTRYHQTG